MKVWLVGVLSAGATALVGLLAASLLGVFERGSQALDEDAIRKVLQEEMKADINGETLTYGQALSKISTDVALNRAALEALAGT